MILLSLWWLCTFTATASGGDLSHSLDALLQEHAFRAFVRPRTGVAYDGAAPPNLNGIRLSAMRLKSGSLMTRGVRMYKEFEIPKGVVTHPYVERLALLYHNLANWSLAFYPLPGYTYLAPVVGLVAYDASDLEANGLPHLSIRASAQPISIHFSQLLARPFPLGAPPPKCVFFDLNGSVALSDMSPDGVCTTFRQGHFSIVVESVAAEPMTRKQGENHSKVWKIVGAVFGGFTLLAVLGAVVGWARKYKLSKKMHSMETAAEVGETLFMAAIGATKAPAAVGTRTHPKLEMDYVP